LSFDGLALGPGKPHRIEQIRETIPQFVIDKGIFLELKRIKVQDLNQIGRQMRLDQISGCIRMGQRIVKKVVVRCG